MENSIKKYFNYFLDYIIFDQKPMKGFYPMTESIYDDIEKEEKEEEKIKKSDSMVTIDLEKSLIDIPQDPIVLGWVEVK